MKHKTLQRSEEQDVFTDLLFNALLLALLGSCITTHNILKSSGNSSNVGQPKTPI